LHLMGCLREIEHANEDKEKMNEGWVS